MTLPNIFKNEERKTNIIELEIPYYEEEPIISPSLKESSKIIERNQESLIEALEYRAMNCYTNLISAINNTSSFNNNGETIQYEDKNGKVHDFNVTSYNAMKACIKILKRQEYIKFSRHQYEQMLKAVTMWDGDREIFTDYNELVRYLIHRVFCG